MKRILVTDANKEKLEAAIKEAEGKATARTTSVYTIRRVLDRVGNGIAKKYLDGTVVYYTDGQHFPNAYSYRPDSTHWTAENVKGKWYITNIYRGTCPNRSWNTEITYSETAKAAILDKLSCCDY